MTGRFKKSTAEQKHICCNSFICKSLMIFGHSVVEKVELLPITHVEKINFKYTRISLYAKSLHFLHRISEGIDIKRVKEWRMVLQNSTGGRYEPS